MSCSVLMTSLSSADADAGPSVLPGSRILVAGSSTSDVCGVRDHAEILSASLAKAGVGVETVWEESGDSLPVWHLARVIVERCRRVQPDAVLLEYSVFAFSWRGIPVVVPLLAWALRRVGVPVILFAHEFAYPWRRRGWRGWLHAVSQRVALAPLVATADALIVTTDNRVEWMQSRWWLPGRPVICAPVFSNISVSSSASSVEEIPGRVGIFSFGAECLEDTLVTAAIARVTRVVPDAHLLLIGAPGPDSAAGRRWKQVADEAGCPVMFTGAVEEDEVSTQLSTCPVMLFPDPAGPSSRKTSLAAALAHGRAVIALDGPERWKEFLGADAVVMVEPSPERLAASLGHLLTDPAERSRIGGNARAFAEQHQSPARAAEQVLMLTQRVVDAGSAP